MSKPSEHDSDSPTRRRGPVEVREMLLEDLPVVFALGERLFRAEAYPNLYRTWEEWELLQHYANEQETCLVATIDDDVVGFVLGSVIDKARSAWRYGYVVWLGVDPSAARRGVAGRLLAHLTELFVEEGVRILLVDTEATNEPAISFFHRQGFAKQRQHVYLQKNLEHDEHWARAVKAVRKERKRRERERDKRREPPPPIKPAGHLPDDAHPGARGIDRVMVADAPSSPAPPRKPTKKKRASAKRRGATGASRKTTGGERRGR